MPASMASRSAGTDSVEVSMTRSAVASTGASMARSAAMPSARVWLPCSGWLRRFCSYRRTRMSSDASRNNTRGVMSRVAKSLRTQSKSPVKPLDLTSITTASWVIREPAAKPRSTMRAMSSGGRLSATYQPRSSSTLAAVPRPAPDSPVTRTTSMPVSAPDPRGRVLRPAVFTRFVFCHPDALV